MLVQSTFEYEFLRLMTMCFDHCLAQDKDPKDIYEESLKYDNSLIRKILKKKETADASHHLHHML